MRWEQGRETLQPMIDAKELQRVPASREHADRRRRSTDGVPVPG
jgi:hypothetical protein